MVAQLVEGPHPIVACTESATASLTEALTYQPVFMDTDSKRAALLAISNHERHLAALKLKVMAASADVADADGARDVAAWLAPRTQAELRPLRVEQRLAEALDERWNEVASAMAAGAVSVEQAQVIVRGLEALPAHVGLEVVARAEAQLVEYAARYNATELRILARRILDVVAPEIAEGEEAKRLEEEERRARDSCRLALKPLGDGTTRISGVIPDSAGQRLLAYLDAFTSPRKHPEAINGEEDRIPYRRQLAQAFCSLLERLDPAQLPEHGGDATTLMVTIPLESLKKDLGVGAILGGQPMSASEVRRLACEADIIPVVLGGTSEILDVGRKRRLHPPAQRKAIRLRHPTCAGEGCSVPSSRCEIHHLQPWSEGGTTTVKDGVPVCSYHHHRIHDATYTHETLPNGEIRFTRVR